MKQKTSIETLITPAWAHEVLTRHYARVESGKFRQRPISQGLILKYTAEMHNGTFILLPTPIAFDVNDDLIDGQHRLEAVRRSKVSVKMMVSYGWPAEKDENGISTIDVIDTGKPRSVAQILHMHGVESAKNYASCIRFMARVANAGGSPVVGVSQTVHFLNHEGLKESIDRIVSRTATIRDFQARLVGPMAYYHTVRPNKAMGFAEGVFRLEFEQGNAIHAFCNWLKNRPQVDTGLRLKALASAIRSWDEGKDVEVTRPTLEAVEWLANLNPKLRAKFRDMCPRIVSGTH